jgi:hypothetical protein
VRPGDAGYNRAALDACVDELAAAPVSVEVEASWTLSDGFCVVYRHSARSTLRAGYCARAVPSTEFDDPVEWGEDVAVDRWDGPHADDDLRFDTHGIGWDGALDATLPLLPNDV